MPEIDDKCEFVIGSDKLTFHTQTDGDTLNIHGMELTKEQAASLTWLINHNPPQFLKVKIKLN